MSKVKEAFASILEARYPEGSTKKPATSDFGLRFNLILHRLTHGKATLMAIYNPDDQIIAHKLELRKTARH